MMCDYENGICKVCGGAELSKSGKRVVRVCRVPLAVPNFPVIEAPDYEIPGFERVDPTTQMGPKKGCNCQDDKARKAGLRELRERKKQIREKRRRNSK